MQRLIDADALIRKLHERLCKIDNGRRYAGMSILVFDGVRMDELEYCIELIHCEPIIEAEPVRNGEWIYGKTVYQEWMICSECNVSQNPTGLFSFCPNCGAKMDVKKGASNDGT